MGFIIISRGISWNRKFHPTQNLTENTGPQISALRRHFCRAQLWLKWWARPTLGGWAGGRWQLLEESRRFGPCVWLWLAACKGQKLKAPQKWTNLVAQYLSYMPAWAPRKSSVTIYCPRARYGAPAIVRTPRSRCPGEIWCAFSLRIRADDNFCRIWVFVCLRPHGKGWARGGPERQKKGAFKKIKKVAIEAGAA